MRAYLIDPLYKTITEVDWDGNYKSIYTHIEADCFDCARFSTHGDAVYVSDNGLIDGTAWRVGMFEVAGYAVPLAGKGLVLGHNGAGKSVEPHISLADLRAAVKFPSIDEVHERARRGEFD